MSIAVVFICGPKHMCAVVQPFSPSGVDGEVILVRWGKNGRQCTQRESIQYEYTYKKGEGAAVTGALLRKAG